MWPSAPALVHRHGRCAGPMSRFRRSPCHCGHAADDANIGAADPPCLGQKCGCTYVRRPRLHLIGQPCVSASMVTPSSCGCRRGLLAGLNRSTSARSGGDAGSIRLDQSSGSRGLLPMVAPSSAT
jgi:hypothetical protein